MAPHVLEVTRGRRLRRTLTALEALLVLGAFGGAVGLMSGALDVGETAQDLPWQSPVLAGVALGLINGVFPAAVMVLARRHHRWAPAGHVLVGVALMGWIVVQVAFIGLNSALQVLYFVYGAVVAAMGDALRRQDDGSGREAS